MAGLKPESREEKMKLSQVDKRANNTIPLDLDNWLSTLRVKLIVALGFSPCEAHVGTGRQVDRHCCEMQGCILMNPGK
jgi:hypothetical protein